jgi:hypothetical protein
MTMAIAALVTWLVTAVGGFVMLGSWISRGGHKTRTSKLPPGMVFGHFGLAALGLVLWIIYVVTDSDALTWVAFVVLLPVAALGFAMFARWLPGYRAKEAATADGPAERHFPVPVVAGHGLFAATTLVLVLLTALGIGGS